MVLSAKNASLLALVFQQSAVVLIIKYSKTRQHDPYLSLVAVWMAEIVKMLLAITLEYNTSHHKKNVSLFSVTKEFFSMSPVSESFKLIIPALLYVVQNNLMFVALSHLSVPTYQITNQGKLLTTAIISRIMLNKQISSMQYLSLVVLAGGVALVNLSEYRVNSSNASTSSTDTQNTLLGLSAVIVSCITSGFCGVYFELILKTTQISVHNRNFQLAFWSFLLAAVSIFIKEMPKVAEKGLFQGFDIIVFIVIIFQALTGLVVSLVLKYADAILKGFATSIAVAVATAVSMVLFDTTVSYLFFLGICLVGSAIKMYTYYPYDKDTDVFFAFFRGRHRVKIVVLMLVGFGALSSYLTVTKVNMNVSDLSFEAATKEVFRVPTDNDYLAKWGAIEEFNKSKMKRVTYLRNERDIETRGRSGDCESTLNVLAWLMDKVNASKNLLMVTYGTSVRVYREKEFVNPSSGELIDDNIDTWASAKTVIFIGKLEQEMFDQFGWTVRVFVNADNYAVLLQMVATCGHEPSGLAVKARADRPTIQISPFPVVLLNGTRVFKDLWLGNTFPESMVYPPMYFDFVSIGSSRLLHLQLPRQPLDIIECLYGNLTSALTTLTKRNSNC